MKRFLSAMLAAVMLFTSTVTDMTVMAENDVVSTVDGSGASTGSQMSIEGTNSFGAMIADAMQYEMSEQLDTGYSIGNIELNEDLSAKVHVRATKDCKVIVGIFSDDGKNMLTHAEFEAAAGLNEYTVQLDAGAVPQYFILRGFIVDNDTNKALSRMYEDTNNTKAWQDFFAKTTDDFDAELIYNFDDDKTNNFAVYRENVKQIISDGVHNTVISIDEAARVYKFGNIDENISSLKAGDMFSFIYENGGMILAEIADISIDGDTAIVTGEQITAEDLFSFIKINFDQDSIVDECNSYDKIEEDEVSREALSAPAYTESDYEMATREVMHSCYASASNDNINEKFKPVSVSVAIKAAIGDECDMDSESFEKNVSVSGEFSIGELSYTYSFPNDNGRGTGEFQYTGNDGSTYTQTLENTKNSRNNSFSYEKDDLEIEIDRGVLDDIREENEEIKKKIDESLNKVYKGTSGAGLAAEMSNMKAFEGEFGVSDLENSLSAAVLGSGALMITNIRFCYNSADNVGKKTEIFWDYKAHFKLAFSIKDEFEMQFASVFFPPLEAVGVHLAIDFSLVIESESNLTLTTDLEGYFKATVEDGKFPSLDSTCDAQFGSEYEGELFIGVCAKPNFTLLGGVVNAEFSLTPGVKATTTVGGKQRGEENHGCDYCTYGNDRFVLRLGFELGALFGFIKFSNEWTCAESVLFNYHCSNKDNYVLVWDVCEELNFTVKVKPYIYDSSLSEYNLLIKYESNGEKVQLNLYENQKVKGTYNDAQYVFRQHSDAEKDTDGSSIISMNCAPDVSYRYDVFYTKYRNRYDSNQLQFYNEECFVLSRLHENATRFNTADNLIKGDVMFDVLLQPNEDMLIGSVCNKDTGKIIDSGTIYAIYYPGHDNESDILAAEKNGCESVVEIPIKDGKFSWHIPYGTDGYIFNIVADGSDGCIGYKAFKKFYNFEKLADSDKNADGSMKISLTPIYAKSTLVFKDPDGNAFSGTVRITLVNANTGKVVQDSFVTHSPDKNGSVALEVPSGKYKIYVQDSNREHLLDYERDYNDDVTISDGIAYITLDGNVADIVLGGTGESDEAPETGESGETGEPGEDEEPVEYIDVTFKIVDENGDPVEGASVYFTFDESNAKTTDSNGVVTLTSWKGSGGTIRIEKNGYTEGSYSYTGTEQDGDVKKITITSDTVDVEITVTEADGVTPIGGVVVNYTYSTDANGKAVMRCTKGITIRMEIFKDNYVKQTVEFVADGTPQKFKLMPDTVANPAEDFEYMIISNDKVMILNYVGTDTTVVIPDEIEGLPVTSIGECASGNYESTGGTFYGYTDLISVTIPDSVTVIGDYAFGECTNLKNIIIPDSVTDIGKSAFGACESLVSIAIPDSVTYIGSGAFGDCTSLTGVDIPSGVTSINVGTFSGCTSLTNITIPDGVTCIDDYSFEDCTSLKSINIPNSVTDVGRCSFEGCTSLTSVKLPDSLSSIDYRAFADCTNLANITMPKSMTSLGDHAFEKCSSLTSVTIPDGVTCIDDYTFDGCTSLTSVTIPDGLTSIGDYAFSSCESLADIMIPDVTSIGEAAFANCKNLSSITIPDGVTAIGKYAFSSCESLESITIPYGVTSINESVFSGCSNLTSVTLPNSVMSIGYSAFSKCIKLKDIKIPILVTSIGDYAFFSCESITSIVIPDGATSIGMYAFSSCLALTSITIPASVTEIKSKAIPTYSRLNIYGEAGSYAETYAAENGITFVAIDTLSVAEVSNSAAASSAAVTTTEIFTDLTPNGMYNFYAEDSTTGELVYITQAAAAENGTLSVEYAADGAVNTYVSELVSMDIANAEVIIPEFVYNGNVQYLNPVIKMNGKTLVSGKDYALMGDFAVKEVGVYALGILSMGDYFGYKLINVTVLPENVTIDSIKMASLPEKTEYTVDQSKLDLEGAAIEIVLSDGTTFKKQITDDMVSGFDSTSAGTNTITVTYEGKTTTFAVTIFGYEYVISSDETDPNAYTDEENVTIPVDKVAVQKTAVADGVYSQRFVKKVAATEVVGKSEIVFTVSNGDKTAEYAVNSVYSSLNVNGNKAEAGEGYVFVVFTIKDIPESKTVELKNIEFR